MQQGEIHSPWSDSQNSLRKRQKKKLKIKFQVIPQVTNLFWLLLDKPKAQVNWSQKPQVLFYDKSHSYLWPEVNWANIYKFYSWGTGTSWSQMMLLLTRTDICTTLAPSHPYRPLLSGSYSHFSCELGSGTQKMIIITAFNLPRYFLW